jgi:hypothetical protein
MKAHPFIAWTIVVNAIAIILDCEGSLLVHGGQTNYDLPRVPVLDGIIHSFPDNIIKVRRNRIIVD